jgi:FMN phosphatase YigB (HAD superfamily)
MSDILSHFENATRRGLFNPQWYMQHYGLYFETELDAFADYLRKSRHSWVDPSPNFSTKGYFRVNFAALLNSKIAPLEHFLNKETEDQPVFASVRHWQPRAGIQQQKSYKATMSYAVTAHIFYEDYIERLANCLTHFPFKFDLFVAVSSEEINRTAKEILGRVDSVSTVCVKTVPNRGRNFGPLLVEFGRILLNYDIFCHVHSKKSLFSGSSQEVWGDYLFEYLLRDKQVVLRALALFEESENYGIYFPTSFTRSLPKWASHTLKNRGSMNEMATKLMINYSHSGFLPYPVGGMFWAKTDALRNLLDRDWNYSDFPEEPIPHDGTSLHGIERLLVKLAEHNGYHNLIYHPHSGKFTSESGHIYEEYLGNQDDLGYITQHSPVRVISFDIFDTLVYRTNSYPDQGKEDIAAQLGYENPKDFLELRNRTEFEIRKESGFVGDVSILDIYERLKPALETQLSPKQLADLEFHSDLKYILPKHALIKALKDSLQAGKRVMIASDTYYTKNQIRTLLDYVGVSQDVELYVSSDLGKRKDNGRMWIAIKEVLEKLAINPLQEFMHIGDNVVSDSQIPGDFGLGSYHILNPFDKWNYLSSVRLQESDMTDSAKRHKYGPLIARLGADPFL